MKTEQNNDGRVNLSACYVWNGRKGDVSFGKN